MKPLVIYHADCPDGFGAAFAAWLKLGDEAEYLPMQYGEKAQLDILAMRSSFETRNICILDFSFSREVMEQVFSCAKRFVWLDHHKSAFEMWCGYSPSEDFRRYEDITVKGNLHIVLDNDKSGALLAWEYFHPGTEVPMLIRHIDDYDRWQFKLGGTREFNAVLNSYRPWTFEQWKTKFLYLPVLGRTLSQVQADAYVRFYAEGASLLRDRARMVAQVVAEAQKCHIVWRDVEKLWSVDSILERREGLAANCPPFFASDVGHALATQSGTYGLLWHINKDMKCICSLRSNGDYDVSAIAKTFGGGGHKNAAGFEVPVATLLEWLQ